MVVMFCLVMLGKLKVVEMKTEEQRFKGKIIGGHANLGTDPR